jgi:hypothetical protein
MKEKIKIAIIYFFDITLLPFTIIASIWLKLIRKYNITLFKTISPISKFVFNKIGVFPITNHYYEPLFDSSKIIKSLRSDRNLPGINFNVDSQLNLLRSFNYNSELIEISRLPKNELTFSFNKGPFRSGDAEILYNMVRNKQPKKIIEIGCGHSTLLIQHAINYNKKLNLNYTCEHICIEPYECLWLENLNINVIREKVEELNVELFTSLEKNDILFIDSTHIIRPQGDVLFEYLEILPSLKSGVIVHVHDIFSPKDYLNEWKFQGVNFWDEQYLLEAFLSCNNQFEIICAVNYLKNNFYNELQSKCPLLTPEREPGSFWFRKN